MSSIYLPTCSWSDFFIEQADPWRAEAWDIIRRTPQITYQILTKRPERIAQCLPQDWGNGYANVWLGVSCENQQTADERIPILLQTSAAIRWVSAEPLLGPIDLNSIPFGWITKPGGKREPARSTCLKPHTAFHDEGQIDWPRLDWVVPGFESGNKARPGHPDWARSLRDQCIAAGVPLFYKQNGEWQPHSVTINSDGTIYNPPLPLNKELRIWHGSEAVPFSWDADEGSVII